MAPLVTPASQAIILALPITYGADRTLA
jgi:hypothetical protein